MGKQKLNSAMCLRQNQMHEIARNIQKPKQKQKTTLSYSHIQAVTSQLMWNPFSMFEHTGLLSVGEVNSNVSLRRFWQRASDDRMVVCSPLRSVAHIAVPSSFFFLPFFFRCASFSCFNLEARVCDIIFVIFYLRAKPLSIPIPFVGEVLLAVVTHGPRLKYFIFAEWGRWIPPLCIGWRTIDMLTKPWFHMVCCWSSHLSSLCVDMDQ